jgi:hypothetical protein
MADFTLFRFKQDSLTAWFAVCRIETDHLDRSLLRVITNGDRVGIDILFFPTIWL